VNAVGRRFTDLLASASDDGAAILLVEHGAPDQSGNVRELLAAPGIPSTLAISS
jgi:hypothetical protein